MNGDKSIVNRSRNVHRTAVDADRELRGADQINQLEQSRLIDEIQAIVWRREFAVRSPDENYPGWGKGTAEFLDDRIR